MLFFVVGAEASYIAIRYKTYKVQMKRVHRASLRVMALGCLLWGTGWLVQLYGSGVFEDVFKAIGDALFVINVPLPFSAKSDTANTACSSELKVAHNHFGRIK